MRGEELEEGIMVKERVDDEWLDVLSGQMKGWLLDGIVELVVGLQPGSAQMCPGVGTGETEHLCGPAHVGWSVAPTDHLSCV